MVVSKLAQRLIAGGAFLVVVVGGVACDAILGSLHDQSSDGGLPDATSHVDGAPHTDAHPQSQRDAGTRADTGTENDAESPPKDAGAPSCSEPGEGLTDCPTEGGAISCCASPLVEAGTFHRAYNAADAGFGVCADGGACDGGTHPGSNATLSEFRLDEYLVTVGRFRKFREALTRDAGLPANGSGRHSYLNDGGGLAISGTGTMHESGWNALSWNGYVTPTDTLLKCDSQFETWTVDPGGNEEKPITCVNWYEAYAFCIWDGGFLPSEAEWEYAAAGGGEQRDYPWGHASPTSSVVYAVYGNPVGPAGVGSAPAGAARWGQLDMAGEAYEWVLDYFATYISPCVNCAYLTPTMTGDRSQRTHLFGDPNESDYLTPPYRGSSDPIGRNSTASFRSARAP